MEVKKYSKHEFRTLTHYGTKNSYPKHIKDSISYSMRI